LSTSRGVTLIVDETWTPREESYFPDSTAKFLKWEKRRQIAEAIGRQINLAPDALNRVLEIEASWPGSKLEHTQCIITPLKWEKDSCFQVVVAGLSQAAFDSYRAGIVAVANHELRTPLTIFNMATQMFLNKVGDQFNSDPEMAQIKDMILDASQRLNNTMSNLLDFGELLTPYPVGEMRALDFDRLVTDCIIEKRESSQHKNWHIIGTEEQISVEADGDALRKAIHAVLDNACTFSDPESEISVILHADRKINQCFLKITDSGIGISDEHQQKIFQAFYHVEDAMYKHTPGLGLGLTIAQKILALHGGRIHVDSMPQAGTSVTIKLPIFSP